MNHKPLPSQPDLDQLRIQAKELLAAWNTGDAGALQRLEQQHPRFSDSSSSGRNLKLADAQLVIARECGFRSWPKLKHHVEQLHSVQRRIHHLQAEFANAEPAQRQQLMTPLHSRERLKHYTGGASELSEDDARLIVANAEGYASWRKYQSYLHLDSDVQQVIQAVRTGQLERLRSLLRAAPEAANPQWVPGQRPPKRIPNDSIPLFCISEGIFNGTNPHGNDYQLACTLLEAGADASIENGLPLTGAVSYNAPGAVTALLENSAPVDGPDGKGAPMAYALHFGFTRIAEQLATYGARLDLRFAAGLGNLGEVEKYFVNGALADPEHAGALGDPYEDRFRCPRTTANVLNQALYFACLNGRLKTAEFLIGKGADVNALIPGLDVPLTILHWLTTNAEGTAGNAEAVETNRLPVVDFLLQCGARTDIRDARFQATALNWADYHRRTRIGERLKQHSPES